MGQTIDTYKLTSLEEPSDEILSQLMQEAAEHAKAKGQEAQQRYLDKYMADAEVAMMKFKKQYPTSAN